MLEALAEVDEMEASATETSVCQDEPAYGVYPIKRRRRTKAAMTGLRKALYEILAADHPMTIRQVFYQMVGRGCVAKTEGEYDKTVGRLLLEMRRDGQIPYEWIADHTRWIRKSASYHSAEQALYATAKCYRRSLWYNQDAYVEVWVEKDALAGVLMGETDPYDVPLMVSKGFASETYLYEAAEAIKHAAKPAYLYYFGDRDPSGVCIDVSIERRLRAMAPAAEIHFERVSVTEEQIALWNLPTRPTKQSDPRSKKFIGESVELDAVPAPRLREMVRTCIERHVDRNALEIMRVAETSEREILTKLIDRLPGRAGR